jgi:transcriptional regulator with XRE-family HTH domain
MAEIDLIENFRAALARRGITIKDAARMCSIHSDTLERLLGGRTRKLDAQVLDRIAACAALRRNDWHDRHRFIAEVFDLPLAPETTPRLDSQIAILMARVAQLEGGGEPSHKPSSQPVATRPDAASSDLKPEPK